MDSRTLSENFSAAKVLCILMVIASHWFTDIMLWPLATMALFIFGFSSSFFTGRIYHTKVDLRAFWSKKIQRLGVRYWLILTLLTVLLLAQQDTTVFHWHTLVHYAGLSGVLNLFGKSGSDLGRGLWFFTVLLLFYATYPLMARRFVASRRPLSILVLATVALLLLDRLADPGFSLWMTILGFILGTAVGVNRVCFTVRPLLAAGALAVLGLGVTNAVLGFREFNGVFLFILALSGSLLLTVVDATRFKALLVIGRLEKVLLEIYLIHMYLFVHPTGHSLADFGISLAFIVAAAFALNEAGSRLVAWIFDTPRAPIIVDGEDGSDTVART